MGRASCRLRLTASHLEPTPMASTAPGAAVVDEMFAAFFEGGDAPGVAYGVVVDGKLVHTGGFGAIRVGESGEGLVPAADSIFRIASMSKSFVAATVLLLRDEGVLQLDDPVEKWVPELVGVARPTLDSPAPTIRQLLSMNGGYPEDDPWADRLESLPDDEYEALIGTPKIGRPAGVAYEYSNLGFTLLGKVIQNATNSPSAPAMLELIEKKLMIPLGMTDTAFSDDNLDKVRLTNGYHMIDNEWVVQPIQKPGTFSALGGVYSTVADLAIWVTGFIDAYPARDEPDSHPLSRASRREMQKIHTTMPLELSRNGPALGGYCFGLTSEEDLTTGRIIGHSGGYPGYGSRMVWHPESKVGVIGLANGRYGGPYGTVVEAVEAVVAEVPRQLSMAAHPLVAETLRPAVDAALAAGDLMALEPLLSANVDQDEELARRGLSDIHGALSPEDGVSVSKPTLVGWWNKGEKGRVGVTIMINPDGEIQTLTVTSVLQPSEELESVLADAVASFKSGVAGQQYLAPAVLPIKSVTWVSCDGSTRGVALLEGDKTMSARVTINLDNKYNRPERVVTFSPSAKHESLPA